MNVGDKELVLVGDRVLIKIEKPDERTSAGLYLPQTAIDKTPVQTGRVMAVGPGLPIPTVESGEDEPWRERATNGKYLPVQAEIGDLAFFLRQHAVDVKIKDEDYVVVPQSALLVLLRTPAPDWVEPKEPE